MTAISESRADQRTVAVQAAKRRIRASNEAAILRAAESVFAQVGYAGATIAEIAERAGIPKSNLHYYFRTKRDIYRAVLAHTLALWLAETDAIEPGASPRAAIEQYIRAKMALTAAHPDASRVFANEILHGAPEIGDYLRSSMKELIDRKSAVLETWAAEGRMAPIDPRRLFFTIWATTQTYADFQAQICAVLGNKVLDADYLAATTDELVDVLARGFALAD